MVRVVVEPLMTTTGRLTVASEPTVRVPAVAISPVHRDLHGLDGHRLHIFQAVGILGVAVVLGRDGSHLILVGSVVQHCLALGVDGSSADGAAVASAVFTEKTTIALGHRVIAGLNRSRNLHIVALVDGAAVGDAAHHQGINGGGQPCRSCRRRPRSPRRWRGT